MLRYYRKCFWNSKSKFANSLEGDMNKLSPGWYVKELVSRLTAKPCSDVEKVAILPCFIQK